MTGPGRRERVLGVARYERAASPLLNTAETMVLCWAATAS
jgi:hypothetical protein